MNRKKRAKLHDIYREIPKIACKGHCSSACGSIAMSKGEYEEMSKATGRKPKVVCGDRCNYLDLDTGKCGAYKIRPAVCRLYGVVDVMPCAFGCVPERMLTEGEARHIMDRISSLFGEARRSFVTND